jgi:hypothetical protein
MDLPDLATPAEAGPGKMDERTVPGSLSRVNAGTQMGGRS